MIRRWNLWLPLLVFAVAALLRIAVACRSGLWVDEIFSLAIATGHSLEHPAAAADPTLGDFVESAHPVSAEEFRRYLKHDYPPASPGRVVRAVFLSETNPPLYYLLLYAWTLVFGTSDLMLRSFSIACLPSLHPLRVFAVRDLLLDGRSYVLASLAMRACDNVGFLGPASAWRKHRPLRALDCSVSGRISDALLLRVSVAGNCSLPFDRTGKTPATTLGGVFILCRYNDSPVVRKTAGEPRCLAYYKRLDKVAANRI